MINSDEMFAHQGVEGRLPPSCAGIGRDSRSAAAGEAFFAMGEERQQAAHAAEALARGAAVVVAERPLAGVPDSRLAVVAHARWCYARASAAVTGVDRAAPPLLGATGTKGKSTVVHCAWWALGPGAGRVGTIGWHDGATERYNTQTTPPPEELHRFLAGLKPGCQGVALEISSHGADQQRLAGLRLRALTWTGIGHDHLDYHGSAAAYLAAKLRTPRWLEEGATCIINVDDATGSVAAHAARIAGAKVIGLGLGIARIGAHESAQVVRHGARWRLDLRGESLVLPSPLPGGYNAWNAAAAALMAEAAGVPLGLALERLASLPGVPGRMELLAHEPATYVDYAHTAESITVALGALRVAHPDRRIAIVFGCGGDRDRTKRSPMGRAASAADVVVVTTDNSRSESPAAIADEILAGISQPAGALVELNRGEAILLARRLAGAEGVVLVAGKGHETTQDIQGVISPWDDRAFVRSLEGGRP